MGIAGKRSRIAGKHQKSKQILVTENAIYVLIYICVHQIIMTNDNERIDFSFC